MNELPPRLPHATPTSLAPELDHRVESYLARLVQFRRDVHAHPELGRQERRTTANVARELSLAGLDPQVLDGGAGLICDIGQGEPLVALRADLDALPIPDGKVDVAYRSTVSGVCHACGHDVHTAVLLGAGLVLADLAGEGQLGGRVRLIFQPAEEAMPGGALDVIAAGGLDGVQRIFALHCDPRQDVGTVGLRVGLLTGSSDHLRVELTSEGGHTARPHLTGDLVYALAKVVSDVPSVLSRRVDPRAGLSLVWGQVHAGGAANVIPQTGSAEGTVRSLDARAWENAPHTVTEAVQAVASPYGVQVRVEYTRGVPPVVNDTESVLLIEAAARAVLGEHSIEAVEQSLGGEDFAWYLEKIPGALFRLGVRTPGDRRENDLHQSTFDVDEGAIGVGVRMLAAVALGELASLGRG